MESRDWVLALGHFEALIARFDRSDRRATTINRIADTRFQIARCYHGTNQIDLMIRWYLDAGTGEAMYNLALHHEDTGDMVTARTYYQRAHDQGYGDMTDATDATDATESDGSSE
jgi:hypothetical protein